MALDRAKWNKSIYVDMTLYIFLLIPFTSFLVVNKHFSSKCFYIFSFPRDFLHV